MHVDDFIFAPGTTEPAAPAATASRHVRFEPPNSNIIRSKRSLRNAAFSALSRIFDFEGEVKIPGAKTSKPDHSAGLANPSPRRCGQDVRYIQAF
jgi:hypothetical protein